jgi:hypothetical protein
MAEIAVADLGPRCPATVTTWTNASDRFVVFLELPPEVVGLGEGSTRWCWSAAGQSVTVSNRSLRMSSGNGCADGGADGCERLRCAPHVDLACSGAPPPAGLVKAIRYPWRDQFRSCACASPTRLVYP